MRGWASIVLLNSAEYVNILVTRMLKEKIFLKKPTKHVLLDLEAHQSQNLSNPSKPCIRAGAFGLVMFAARSS